VHDQFDITLEDSDLLSEVELTTDLMIAATGSDLPLSPAEIDRLLGIAPLTSGEGLCSRPVMSSARPR
jgi:hypothetical protein